VDVAASNGLTVTALRMKGSTMSSWEVGVSQWGYYHFSDNTPYSPPFSFQAMLSTGQIVEGTNVISTGYTGESGTIYVSSAMETADNMVNDDDQKHWVWIVVEITLTVSLVLCIVLIIYVMVNKKAAVIESNDTVKLKEDQQIEIRGSEDQMIELEESIEECDGDMTTIQVSG